VQSAPLWLIKATLPARGILVDAKVAFSPVAGFITPRQFGPIKAQAAATNPFQNFAFQLAAVFSVLLKSGRDNDSTSHSGFDAFRNNVWNSWGWRHNHCEVHRLGDLSHPRVCLDTEDACMFHAHRINRPAKRAAYQTPQHGPPYASSPIGGANYCDRLRMKDGVQRLSFSAQYIVSAIM
jgi:hypothetical protein